ncbi:hypothetical protein ACT2E5_05265 [Burkholderia vietnamiensis]|uniref:hypothetical protein n=1 Tax=Burkholderia vietnamiensis TaxID=60552 RepID=UPI00402ADB7F
MDNVLFNRLAHKNADRFPIEVKGTFVDDNTVYDDKVSAQASGIAEKKRQSRMLALATLVQPLRAMA